MEGHSRFIIYCFFVWLSVSYWIAVVCADASSLKDEADLRKSLFAKYDRDQRLVYNRSTITLVNITFNLQSVQNLDTKTQVLKTAAYLVIMWMDELLKWKPADYDGLSSIVVKPHQIWMPDLILDNGANGFTRIGREEFLVIIEYSGMLIWAPGDVFQTQCMIDVTFYPFDRQICFINITSWMYSADVVKLIVEPSVNLAPYVQNGEFSLVETSASDKSVLFDGIPYSFSVIRLVLERRGLFCLINTILPVLFLSTLNALVFIIPPEAGEKMSLSITVLLAYAVFLSIVKEDMPDTSLSVSLLAVYILMVLGLGTASIVLSAIVLHLHHKVPNTRDILHCLKRVPKTRPKPELLPTDYQGKKNDIPTQKSTGRWNSDPTHKTARVRGTISELQDDRYYKELVNRIDIVSFWLILGLTIFGYLIIVILLTTSD